MDEDRENQLVEVEAIESVLKEGRLKRCSEKPLSGEIILDFDEINVKIRGISETGDKIATDLKFPPLARLCYTFPDDYPSVSMPTFDVKSDWMNEEQTKKCLEELKNVCADNESMPVLYFCYERAIEFMSEIAKNEIWINDAYVLKTEKNLTISQLCQRINGQIEVNEVDHFKRQIFECKICYDEFDGDKCYRFEPCQHVFCIQCITNYYVFVVRYELRSDLKCLSDKCETPCEHTFIQKILSVEDFSKYETFLLSRAIQDIENAIQCPREECQKVAYLSDPDKNLVECSYCNSSFCNLCKNTYHGVEACKFKIEDKSAILEEWRNASVDERKEMAKNFGGMKNLEMIIENFENDAWKEANSKQCPKCSISIEKNEGCHKMHCTKCDTYFCWLCTKTLLKTDPYGHFRENGECSGRLFEGVVPHEEDEDEEDDEQEEQDFLEFFAQQINARELGIRLNEAFDYGSDDEDDEDYVGEEEQ